MRGRVFLDIAIDGQAAGRMIFKLYKDVPKTAENFRSLCAGDSGKRSKNYPLHFKGSIFHRVIPGFMAQGGDFNRNNGTGGCSIYGPQFSDENFLHKHSKRGLLSMANSGINSNGSQFFILFDKANWLDGKHVVFGELEEGDDTLTKIEQQGTRGGMTQMKIKVVDCGEAL
ncbi:peptidylprolyl isomerase protein [Entomophthora muscae]|uniref:Peptidylprolyl isomerase protein n=1 Tax=Entomophthora muscae TaxID=34485 RepID=A0ACC2TZL5_9FUNG|nr:peptidylprolyl isomerase protein [Entomophthora muscae]